MDRLTGGAFRRHADASAGRRIFGRVINQPVDNLRDGAPFNTHDRQLVFDFDFNLMLSSELFGAGECRLNKLVYLAPVATQAELTSLNACEIDNTFDEAVEPVNLLSNHTQHRLLFFRAERFCRFFCVGVFNQ
jgi:hypothetical protein